MDIKSFSSNLMTIITLNRNHSKSFVESRIVAGIGYIFTTVISTIETLALTILLVLSIFMLLFTTKPTKNLYKRLESSSFSIIWSSFDFIINLFTMALIADEKSARKAVARPCYYPRDALLWSPYFPQKNDSIYDESAKLLETSSNKVDNLKKDDTIKSIAAKSKKNIKILPKDCLLTAFSFLPANDILNIRSVSKGFNGIVRSDDMGEDLIKRDFVNTKIPEKYKFSFYQKNLFNYNPNFLNFLLKNSKTSITPWGKRKIIFSDGCTEDLKKFLNAIFNNVKYNVSQKQWLKIEGLCKQNEYLLKNASLIQKISNFFRDLFSDAAEIPNFENSIFKEIKS